MSEQSTIESGASPTLQPDPGSLVPRADETKRLLIVDDDPISRNIVRDLVVGRGFEAEGADGAQAALEKVRRQRYDLLILDIFLPGLDGRVLHGSIEKINPGLTERTIFISHWVPTGAIAEYVAKHGVFLKKPFAAEDLLKAIRVTLGVASC